MKIEKLKAILIAVSVIITTVVIVIFTGERKCVTFYTTTICDKTLKSTVMVTEYVQPMKVVDVGTQIFRVINKIYEDYNSQVKEGLLLAQFEIQKLLKRVNQAKTSLRVAHIYEKVQTLYKVATTRASYEDVTDRQNQTDINLFNELIYCPNDGVVIDRSLNTGQTVVVAFSTQTFFTITDDLTKMQVEVDVDEANIEQVIFTVNKVRLQPIDMSSAIAYEVVGDIPNLDEKLLLSLTFNITMSLQNTSMDLLQTIEIIYQMQ